MREGAEMTICAFGGLMRKYMFLMDLRMMITVIPAICVVSPDSVRLRAPPLLLRRLYVIPTLCHDTPKTHLVLTFFETRVLFQFVVLNSAAGTGP